MGDRTDLPKIKPEKQPSFFNREAGGWGLLGSLLGSCAAAGTMAADGFKFARAAGPNLTDEAINAFSKQKVGKYYAIWGGIAAAGTIFGGLKGLSRQKKEQEEGVVVKTPTSWNSGIFSGWLVGGLAMMPVNLVLSTVAKAPVGVTNFLGAAAAITGMFVGSNIRKNTMQHDLDRAVKLQEEAKGQAPGQGLQHLITYKDSVAPHESAALAEKQERAGEQYSHAHAHLKQAETGLEARRA